MQSLPSAPFPSVVALLMERKARGSEQSVQGITTFETVGTETHMAQVAIASLFLFGFLYTADWGMVAEERWRPICGAAFAYGETKRVGG